MDYDRYAYVRNNPLIYVDPGGHTPWLLIPVAIIFLVGLSGDSALYEKTGPGNDIAVDAAVRSLFGPYDWFRTTQDCFNGDCSVIDVIFAAAPVVSGGLSKLADLAKISPGIEKLPGIDSLLTKLNHASEDVRLGAQGELAYLLSHKDEVAEVGKSFGGGLEMDFVLKDGTFVNVKNYNWASYNEFTLGKEIENMLAQAEKYRQFNPTAIRLYFTSKPPQRVIDALKAAGLDVGY
jgi:hypothetical protein